MRTILIGFLAVTAFAGSATAASAEQWREVAVSDVHPFRIMYVDQASVLRQGHNATAWVMTVMEKDGSQDWDNSIIFRQVDCNRNMTQMVHSKFYDGLKLIEDRTTPTEWRTILEGSMFDGVADVMCGRRDYTSPVVADPVSLSFKKFKIM